MIKAFDPLKIKRRTLSSGFSFTQYGDSFCVCGQPQKANLEELKKENWDLILNVRNLEEMQALDFKMEELCQTIGFNYRRIPIIQEGELSKKSFETIHKIISSGDYKKTVIHCAVGGRATLTLLACFMLSKKAQWEELPDLAHHFNFQSPQMLNRLQELFSSMIC